MRNKKKKNIRETSQHFVKIWTVERDATTVTFLRHAVSGMNNKVH